MYVLIISPILHPILGPRWVKWVKNETLLLQDMITVGASDWWLNMVKPPTVGRGKGMSPWRYARQNTSTKLDQHDKPWTDKPRTITHKERSK